MTITTEPPRASAPALESSRPAATPQFVWAVVVLSAVLVAGLYVDLWAHAHDRVDESFFTPWHGILYGGYTLGAAYLAVVASKGRRRGLPLSRVLPEGFGLSLAGAALFAAGGVGDMIWHMVFGIEVNIDALFSPTHLVLATGGTLIVAGPLRAALLRPTAASRLPAVLSLAFVLAVFGAMTQFASPLVEVLARRVDDQPRIQPEILVMQPDGRGQTRLTMETTRAALQPAWSPDGSRIAYLVESPDEGTSRIHVMDADGEASRAVTGGRHDRFPAWSPDGARIAYSAGEHQADVFVVEVATGATRRVTLTPSNEDVAGWSPDGTKILVASTQSGNWDVAVVDAADGSVTLLTTDPSDEQSPSWSSDGRRIAFVSDRDGNPEIYAMRPDGTARRRLTHDRQTDFEPHWSPDGTRIAFVSWRGGEGDVYTMNADGTGVANVSRRASSDEWRGLSWSQRGIAFTSQGHDPFWEASFFRQALGMASIFVQTAILMGFVLLAVRRRALPFGGLALVFAATAALMGLVGDEYRFVPGAFVAGLFADVLARRLRPDRSVGGLRAFAFAVPAVYYALYFAAVQAGGGVGWSVHMWAGAVVIAGMIGALLSYLVVPPARPGHGAA